MRTQFKTPTTAQIESVLNKLNAARNALDELTFEAPQEYRKAIYPLHDCIEALHQAMEAKPSTPPAS